MALASMLTTEQEIDAALERAKGAPDLPDAVAAEYNRELDAIVLHIAGGRRLILPRKELQGLEKATEAQLAQIEIFAGRDICWPQLDVDHYLPSLMAGQYGSTQWMRRLECLGVPDVPRNSGAAMARLRAFYALEPLIVPFSHVEGQPLKAVSEMRQGDSLIGVKLGFEKRSLFINVVSSDNSIEVTLEGDGCEVEISQQAPWSAFVGQRVGLMWLAMNQHGYTDTALLAFGESSVPEISLTVVASELKIEAIAAR